MYNITPPEWALPERLATPEHVFLNRRQWLAGAGLLATTAIAGPSLAAQPEDLWEPKAPLNPAYADPGRDPQIAGAAHGSRARDLEIRAQRQVGGRDPSGERHPL